MPARRQSSPIAPATTRSDRSAKGERVMSHATVVRYTTRPGSADENEKLIKAVFAQLTEQLPHRLRYVAIRLDDGVTFMHIAILEDDQNPLAALPAFGEFVSAIDERCASGPTAVDGTVVGAYGIAD